MLKKRNTVLSFGFNQRKSHPLQAKYSKNSHSIFLHAEIDAIVKALKTHTLEDISKSTLYVARTLKNGSKAMAKPCVGCQRAIAAFDIKEVVYTTNEGYVRTKCF